MFVRKYSHVKAQIISKRPVSLGWVWAFMLGHGIVAKVNGVRNPMKRLNLLLSVHAAITFVAACVLVWFPSVIPALVGVTLTENQYLICYLLAAFELCMAYLSWQSRRINDPHALSVVVKAIILLHGSSAVLELYVALQTMNLALIANIVARIIVCFVFYGFGLRVLRLRCGAE